MRTTTEGFIFDKINKKEPSTKEDSEILIIGSHYEDNEHKRRESGGCESSQEGVE